MMAGAYVGGTLAVALILLTGSPLYAWNFSCGNTDTKEFEKKQPQVYVMLDESGSMGGLTNVSQSYHKCDYSIEAWGGDSTKTMTYSDGPDTQTTSFNNTPACTTAEVSVNGDFNGSNHWVDISAEGNQVDKLCDDEYCDDCFSFGTNDFGPYTIPTGVASDGQVSFRGDTSSPVNSCSRFFGAWTESPSTEIRLNEYDNTSWGDFECSWCRTNSDCRTALNNQMSIPACAINGATHSVGTRSVTKTKWDVATSSIRSVVGDMTAGNPDAAQFGIGFFSWGARNEVTPKENAYSSIDYQISQTGPGGSTNLEAAIDTSRQTLNSASGSSRVKASMVITDGIHNQSPDHEVIEAACDHRRLQGKLFMVGFGSGTDTAFNHAVAAAGGSGRCCKPGTSASNCTTSSPDYVDLCNMTDSQLANWDDGRDLNCTGAFQANNGASLKGAINTIANNLSCTIDVSSLGSGKWKDSYYGCAPEYNCFNLEIDGLNKRIYHKNSSQTPRGWEWANPSQKDQILLDSKWCDQVKNLTNNTVRTQLACMCNETPGGSCTASNAKTCECDRGNWACSQGIDTCDQLSASNCPVDLKGEGDACTVGKGVCEASGTTECQNGTPTCNASPDTSQKGPEVCDGKDNNCDGVVDGGSKTAVTETFERAGNGWNRHYNYQVTFNARTTPYVDGNSSTDAYSGNESGYAAAARGACGYAGLSKTFNLSEDPETLSMYLRAQTDDWGYVSVILQDLNTGTYHTLWRRNGSGNGYTRPWSRLVVDISNYSRNFRIIVGNDDRSSSWCDMWDHGWQIWVDDLNINVDAPSNSLTRVANCTGRPGRCSQGRQVCISASWQGCNQLKQPVAEKCNGIDDDCDGKVDENLTRITDCTGKSGRCADGEQTCRNGNWVGCKQLRKPVPEICNGLDDDCSGTPDDISKSWNSRNWNVSIESQYQGVACGEMNSCVCGPGDPDNQHRANQSSYMSRDAEFDAMVRNTSTGCTCQE